MFCETFEKVFCVTFKKNTDTNRLIAFFTWHLNDFAHFLFQSALGRGTLDKVFCSDEVSNFVKNF